MLIDDMDNKFIYMSTLQQKLESMKVYFLYFLRRQEHTRQRDFISNEENKPIRITYT